jgi:murein DD-endopeptidase MepM/ murein hydrolase activator NlpD
LIKEGRAISRKKSFPKWGSYFSTYLFLTLVGLALVVGAVWLTRTWFDLSAPEIQLQPEARLLGANQTFKLNVTDANSGISLVTVRLRQGSSDREILAQSFPGRRWGTGGSEPAVEIPFTVQPKAWGFQDGPAQLLVEARDYSWMGWFRGNLATLDRHVTIDLTPLRLTFTSINEVLSQGGTGLVTYQVNKPVAKSGIVVNGEFFSGFPLKGGDQDRYLVFFAVPYDLPQPLTLELLAVDQSGSEVRTRLLYRLKPKRWKADKIILGDSFLHKKMAEFQEMNPELKNVNNPVEVFLKINQDERGKNAQVIQEVCSHSQPEQLWQGAFMRLPKSAPKAGFADHRTYYYQNREIDKQVHLGQDLASLERAEVPAANNGIVVFTGLLGIYGKSVILDHGWGLFSLYSHLSEVKVEKGQRLNKGSILGNTGDTGMAGGDHLHFSIMAQGKFVDPLEWWDPHWIKDQVNRQLASVAPATPTAKPAEVKTKAAAARTRAAATKATGKAPKKPSQGR